MSKSTTAIISQLHEVLAPHGFWRHKHTWNRTSGSFIDVIDIQVGQGGRWVTANVGVTDPNAYRHCWGGDPPSPTDEPSCTVRTRIGYLMGDTDVWWPLNDPQTPEAVVQAVAALALPFLERMHSKEALVAFLTKKTVWRWKYPPPIIYLAVLKHDLGDPAGACALLNDLYETTQGPWHPAVGEVLTSLGCR